ncbi:hypothetical protein ABL78_7855 [Leptomonas seymouri]|uniref:Rab3 GTPase-activating protein catalytic subunit n=1 Tax=Leptomonas seymouri TaxID=5684 RepID=A0A0N1HRU4_LEPSE|nr:hypothetical protein ABL78_7855 [Leptomonas seymouri]|eukprot:KPI83123.1 hypothetical protein ABL78_7855 [Leptomonas seymouri]
MDSSSAAVEELPLLIQDYSCANSFEEHVRMIEKYLASLFDCEPLLQSFLVGQTNALKPTRSSPSLMLSRDQGKPCSIAPASGGGGSDLGVVDDGTSSSSLSLVSLLDDNAHSGETALSNVFSQTMTLYAPPSAPNSGESAPLDLELSIAVEVHVRDAGHPITQQYCLPLFFLIRKVAASASYRESETNYLLSLLSTAVQQVLRQQRNRAVLRIGAMTMPPPHPTRWARSAAETLSSPFSFPDGCAPCFSPAGDSYKQSFVGVAPPTPTVGGSLPPSLSSSFPEMSTAEWNLLHQRTFTTRFLSDAFAHPPERCRSLSDFIDVFQLHVGQHSRIRSDDFEGICVSMWEEYALPIPWKFNPRGPPPHEDAVASAAQNFKSNSATGAVRHEVSPSAAASAVTWQEVLERENTYTRLLCGAFTHPFGTRAPPLKHVLFHFQWNQLHDVEAHASSGRSSHLSPFHFATMSSPSAPLSNAVQAAQRKRCITARAIVRDEHMEGSESQHLRELVENYLDLLASRAAHSPAPSASSRPLKGKQVEDSDTGGVRGDRDPERSLQSPLTRSGRQRESGDNGSESEDTECDGAVRPQLHELAAHITEWNGANVRLQASLLRRFATPSPEDRNEKDSPENDGHDDGREGQTRAGVMAAAARRSGTEVTRRLRSLWGEWETHRQLFPIKSSSAEGNRDSRGPAREEGPSGEQKRLYLGSGRRTTASTSERDLRADYFPESFVSRFAYTCATQVSHAEDVLVLWRLCLDRLRALLLGPSRNSSTTTPTSEVDQRKSWQRLLDCLALPRTDPPVDLSQPLLCQKLQLLRFALYSLLHPSENTYASFNVDTDAVCETPNEAAREEPSTPAVLHLITNGEVLVAPAPLPTPPTTADLVLQHAMELNTLGAVAVEGATTAWLQRNALYNDMCLFLYVNKAQEGRVVRFADFVHWHSPRDFVSPAVSDSADSATHSDDHYLSDRMKGQPGDGRRSSHVWWSLWSRAVPRSREEILHTLFQFHEEATRVLDWLASLPEATLLLEVCNACVANALHQSLCHRFLLGDINVRDSGACGGHAWAGGASSSSSSSVPASPRLRPLHHYVQIKCTSLTKDLEAASAILSSRAGLAAGGANSNGPPPQGPSVMEVMELEMLRTFMANALREVGDIEASLCTAVAVHYLLGFTTDAEVAATVRALCAPLASTQTLQMRTVTVSNAAWAACFARQFLQPESRVVRERVVRLTCMAERPLNTCGCFQQLVVHQDATHTMRMALVLTKEVL